MALLNALQSAVGLAPTIASVITSPGDYLRRRVEQIEYDDVGEVRSEVTVEAWFGSQVADFKIEHDVFLCPVSFARKGDQLVRFDITADGRPASLLTRDENTWLSARVLSQLISSTHAVTDQQLEAICGPRGAVHDNALAAVLAKELNEAERAWVTFFASNYALYVVTRCSSDAARMLTIRFEQRLRPMGEPVLRAAPANSGTVKAAILLNHVWLTKRYHVNVVVPPECHVRSRLVLLNPPHGDPQDISIAGPRQTQALEPSVDLTFDSEVMLTLAMGTRDHIWSREAVPISAAVALSTTLAVALLATRGEIPSGLAAILLAPVAGALALGFRRFEHSLVRDMTRALQTLLGVQVALLVIATTLVLTKPLHDVWGSQLGDLFGNRLSQLVDGLVAPCFLTALLFLSWGGTRIQSKAGRRPADTLEGEL